VQAATIHVVRCQYIVAARNWQAKVLVGISPAAAEHLTAGVIHLLRDNGRMGTARRGKRLRLGHDRLPEHDGQRWYNLAMAFTSCRRCAAPVLQHDGRTGSVVVRVAPQYTPKDR